MGPPGVDCLQLPILIQINIDIEWSITVLYHYSTQLAAVILSAGIVILAFRNHTPTDSIRTAIINDSKSYIVTEAEKILLSLLWSPFPNSYVMNRLMAADNDPDMTENIATTPPTTLYIPKSSTPNAFNMTRLVYSDTTIIKSIRK